MSEPSFASLFDFHADLAEIFALHQEALLLLKIDLGREVLGAYRRLLGLHMRHEEGRLLPVFERLGPIAKWPSVLYTGQHQKMNSLLDRIQAELDVVAPGPGVSLRRSVIRLLELETTFKHLVEHHVGAERDGLVPGADRAAPAEERVALLEGFLSEWRRALRGEAAILGCARNELGS